MWPSEVRQAPMRTSVAAPYKRDALWNASLDSIKHVFNYQSDEIRAFGQLGFESIPLDPRMHELRLEILARLGDRGERGH